MSFDRAAVAINFLLDKLDAPRTAHTEPHVDPGKLVIAATLDLSQRQVTSLSVCKKPCHQPQNILLTQPQNS